MQGGSVPKLTPEQVIAITSQLAATVEILKRRFDAMASEMQKVFQAHEPFYKICKLLAQILDEVDAETRFRAASQLTERLPPGLKNPRARESLLQMAKDRNRRPAELMRECFLPAGVVLATSEIDQLRKIRLGHKWVRGEDGQVTEMQPLDLPIPDFLTWILQKAQRITTAIFSDHHRVDDLTDALDPEQPDHQENALDLLLAPEKLREQCEIHSTLWTVASPQERQLLDHLTTGAKMVDIPKLMGLSRSATYTLRDRLRKKSKKHSPRV